MGSYTWIWVVVVVLASLMGSYEAYQFNVGGKDGWVLNPSENYNQWSQRLRFQVNDSIFFKYKKGSDSVLVVNKEDYDTCNTRKPIMKMDGGDSVLKFDRSGPFYFISGKKGRCEKGQKLLVVVLSVKSKMKSPPTPTPTPTPSSPPAPVPGSPSPVGQTPPVKSPPTSPTPLSPSPAAMSPTQAITPSPVLSPTLTPSSPAPSVTTSSPAPSISPTYSPISPSPVVSPTLTPSSPAPSVTTSSPAPSMSPTNSPISPSPVVSPSPAGTQLSPAPVTTIGNSPSPSEIGPTARSSTDSGKTAATFTPPFLLVLLVTLVASVSLDSLVASQW